MSKIVVQQNHSLSPEEAISKISGFQEMMAKYGVKSSWKNHHADLKGLGVSGTIDVTNSEVVVTLKLGMLAKAAGIDSARLKESIEKRLGPALASD
jgi:putative polyhydroxyalkanoate system protein